MTSAEFVYAVTAGIIPSLIWLYFWTREDAAKPEPGALLAGCFLAGILAVLIAAPLEQLLLYVYPAAVPHYIAWAAVEELLKFAAVAAVALRSRWNDDPIDAMIYSVAVALGFSAMENTLFLMRPLSGGDLVGGAAAESMRFMGATLVHVVCSGLVGFSLGWTFYKEWPAKALAWTVAMVAAVAAHAGFNLAVIASGNGADALRVFAWVWGAAVIMIVLFEEVKAVRPPEIHSPDVVG